MVYLMENRPNLKIGRIRTDDKIALHYHSLDVCTSYHLLLGFSILEKGFENKPM